VIVTFECFRHFHLACHRKKVLPHAVQYVVSKRRVSGLWPQNGHARLRTTRLMPHTMAPTSTRLMTAMPTAYWVLVNTTRVSALSL